MHLLAMRRALTMSSVHRSPTERLQLNERGPAVNADDDKIALPSHVAGSGTLDRLVDSARDYAKASTAKNTNKAYAADWKHFARWCRLKGTGPIPPSPEMIGLYLTDLAAPTGKALPYRFRPLIAASLASPGTSRSGASRSIAKTGTSPPCWPGSSASMRDRRCRKRRSCQRTSSRW